MKDLLCLVADKNMEAVMQELLSRYQALQIRKIDFETFVHPQRDPGCLQTGSELLLEGNNGHAHGLIVLDFSWEGRPVDNVQGLLDQMRSRLDRRGLLGWADVVVIDPELENWLFTGSPALADALGWNKPQSVRDWLRIQGMWPADSQKPSDPKRAMEMVFHEARMPRSSAIYRVIARHSSFRTCSDAAFLRLRGILTSWFAQ